MKKKIVKVSYGFANIDIYYPCFFTSYFSYSTRDNCNKCFVVSRPVAHKTKRPSYSPVQLQQLEAMFNANKYPSVADKLYLAENLDMTVKQVTIWFQNRRCKGNKDNKKKIEGPAQPELTSSNTAYDNDLRQWYESQPNAGGSAVPLLVLPVPLQSIPLAEPIPRGSPAQEATLQVLQTTGMMEKMVLWPVPALLQL